MLNLSVIFKQDKELANEMREFLFDVCITGSNNLYLRHLLRDSIEATEGDDKSIEIILTQFNTALNGKCYKEIFQFSDHKNSGIILKEFTLSNEGYGFFGWIRIDSNNSQKNYESPYCLWDFTAVNQYKIKLSLKNGKFVYDLQCLEQNLCSKEIVLSEVLDLNRWYFLELYHLNCNNPENIVTYYK